MGGVTTQWRLRGFVGAAQRHEEEENVGLGQTTAQAVLRLDSSTRRIGLGWEDDEREGDLACGL